jgi:hypothetical protein
MQRKLPRFLLTKAGIKLILSPYQAVSMGE